jgi:polyhydroxyalkanoate synthesis regulator phasin
MMGLLRRAQGTKPQAETTMTTERPVEPVEEVSKDRRSLGEYFERTWGQVEKGVEEAIQRSLAVLKVPRRETLQEFASRLDDLEKRISALEGKGG